jgi:hypothetical protein
MRVYVCVCSRPFKQRLEHYTQPVKADVSAVVLCITHTHTLAHLLTYGLPQTHVHKNTRIALATHTHTLTLTHTHKITRTNACTYTHAFARSYVCVCVFVCVCPQAMKRRLGSKNTTGFLYMERPFFNVDVELKVGVNMCVCICSFVCVSEPLFLYATVCFGLLCSSAHHRPVIYLRTYTHIHAHTRTYTHIHSTRRCM